MADQDSLYSRLGFTEFVSQMSQQMDRLLVPYLYLLVVPIMHLMNSQDTELRSSAAPVFAKLVALLPLAQVCPPINQQTRA